jgi:oxygen-independent coproporphyrinogen-3 oxidase
MAPRHLYVHIPFCARRCSYCDFSIAVRSTTPTEEYVKALRTEMNGLRETLEDATLDTVYLGGGTPSRLGGLGIADVMTTVRDHARISDSPEITIEVNPDDVNDMAVAHWVTAGVNRVSLGSQSFDDSALKWMHRTHDASQIGQAVSTLRRGGIGNISLDLIFALPAHLERSWENDLVRALDLQPVHLSLYGLTVEPQTPIARWADRGVNVQATDESYEEEFLSAHAMMVAAGYNHYEVSNFARPGMTSRHNSAYWTGASYLGVGPSAHSFDGATRRWNVPAYSEWVRRLTAGESVSGGEESLSDDNRVAEEVYLGLRTRGGLAISHEELARIQTWEDAGWAVIDDPLQSPRIRLTATGWLRLDSLAADLVAQRGRPRSEPGRKLSASLGPNPSHCYI